MDSSIQISSQQLLINPTQPCPQTTNNYHHLSRWHTETQNDRCTVTAAIHLVPGYTVDKSPVHHSHTEEPGEHPHKENMLEH